jgi:hypothetical protein
MSQSEDPCESDVEVVPLPVLIRRGKVTRSWWQKFCQAFERVGFYSMAGGVIGLALLIVSMKSLSRHPTAEELVKHIGGAFIVSAIVIFAYEWGSEVKRASNLAASLVNVLQRHVDEIMEADARRALANAVRNLAGDGSEGLSDQLEDFADALHRLAGPGDWAAAGYRAFINQYHKFITDNIKRLADVSLRVKKGDSGGGEPFRIIIPTAAEIADAMVNSTMRELANQGGRYFAVSDGSTWILLEEFKKTQSTAWTNVEMQRVFLLGRRADDHRDVAQIAEIISKHYENAKASNGKYEIRITNTEEYSHSPIFTLSGAQHFGIFAPTGKTPLVFKVEDDQFSRFTVDVASDTMIHEFEKLWDTDLQSLQGPDGGKIMRDYLLAYTMKRLPQDALYRAVSEPESWMGGALARFQQTSVEAMKQRNVRSERIFTFADPTTVDLDRVAEVLRQHYKLVHGIGERYSFRVSLRNTWPMEMQRHIPLGLFATTREGVPDEVVHEMSQKDEPYVVKLTAESYRRFSDTFDKTWLDLKGLTESIHAVFLDRASKLLELVERS